AGSTVVIRCLASADAVMGGGGRAGPGQHIPAGSERVQVLPRKVLVVAVSRLARSAGLLPVTRLSRMSLRSLTGASKLLSSTMPPDSGEVQWLYSSRLWVKTVSSTPVRTLPETWRKGSRCVTVQCLLLAWLWLLVPLRTPARGVDSAPMTKTV